MQTQKYVQHFYRALVVICMVYAVTLIGNTAAAETVNVASSVARAL